MSRHGLRGSPDGPAMRSPGLPPLDLFVTCAVLVIAAGRRRPCGQQREVVEVLRPARCVKVRGVKARRVQVDEIWSFTAAKQKNVASMKTPLFPSSATEDNCC